MKISLALFDLDGTLVDSAPDLAAALDDALLSAGRAPLGLVQVRDYIGHGAARLVHRALTAATEGDADQALFEPVYADFLSNYATRVFDRSSVYPGVAETLGVLREQGWTLACITNKPARFTAPLLAAAGLDRHFAVTVSGDTLATSKPHPGPLLHAAERCGAVPARSVMVGDSLTDLNAAARAGMAAVAVDYGYAGGVDLAAHGARAVISAMSELPSVLNSIVG